MNITVTSNEIYRFILTKKQSTSEEMDVLLLHRRNTLQQHYSDEYYTEM